MAANDAEITAVSVQASKLSPHVKPFVPRQMQQGDCCPTPSSPRYSPNYQMSHGFHDHHQTHYFPFMTGPYSLQDFQTGYSLYPYPVYVVEDVSPHGSYVSPGTFVCPRASLQPQRSRTYPRSKIADHAVKMNSGGMASEAVEIRPSNSKSGSISSSETSEGSSVRNGRITNGEDESLGVMNDRNEVSNVAEQTKCNGLKASDRQTNWKQRRSRQTEKVTPSSNEGSTGAVSGETVDKTSNVNPRSSRESIAKETRSAKPKSFAEIIKQNSSDSIVVVDGNVERNRNSDSVQIRPTSDEEKSNAAVSPMSFERNREQQFVSKGSYRDNSTRVGGNNSQRWSHVQSKRHHQSDQCSRNTFSRRSSTSSDANSVHYEKPGPRSSFVRNGKDHEVLKTLPSKEYEDANQRNGSVTHKTEASLDVEDNDTWTEVKSSRRYKEPKQQARKQVHFLKKDDKDKVVETMDNVSKEISPPPQPPSSQETDQKVNRLESTIKMPTLCNTKALKNTENQLEKSKSESRANNSENLVSENLEGEVKARKKKRKTAGQLKKEHQSKVKTLPAIQGKVLTVSEEFYNQFKQNTTDNSPINNGFKQKLLSGNEFPILGKRNQGLADVKVSGGGGDLAFAMNLLNVNSDDSWSDFEGIDVKRNGHKDLEKKNGGCGGSCVVDNFPALGSLIEPLVTADMAYSSLLKRNFWSLPPRITPVDNGSIDNRTSFLEKLLAESSNKECPAVRDQTKSVEGLIPMTDGFLSNGTDPVPAQSVEPLKKKPKSNSLVQIYLTNLLKKKQKRSKVKYTRIHSSSKYSRKNTRKVIPFIANILDSTAPRRRRGKEREFPRKKKPSALKKVILKEREEKRSIRAAKVCNSAEEVEEENPAESTLQDDAKESCALPCTANSENVTAKNVIHSRKFREYCNQMLNPEIDEVAKKLIQDLIRFHDRLYNKNPIKASMKRRMVIGLREVRKHLKQKELKCLILAPNLERIKSSGGLDDAMYSVIGMAEEQSVPFVFALGRRRLGKVCLKKVPVSCVGIFNYDGSETNFNRLCELAEEARNAYQNTICEADNRFDGISSGTEV